jgi:hypothetical protein
LSGTTKGVTGGLGLEIMLGLWVCGNNNPLCSTAPALFSAPRPDEATAIFTTSRLLTILISLGYHFILLNYRHNSGDLYAKQTNSLHRIKTDLLSLDVSSQFLIPTLLAIQNNRFGLRQL